VLLFQDLAVVVLLMLIPLLAPDPSGASTGMAKIAQVGSTQALPCCCNAPAHHLHPNIRSQRLQLSMAGA
jgi:hypothetical protein